MKIESKAVERKLIRKSMLKWENIDLTGRSLGRGLGRRELIGRVAKEVGKSCQQVHLALKTR